MGRGRTNSCYKQIDAEMKNKGGRLSSLLSTHSGYGLLFIFLQYVPKEGMLFIVDFSSNIPKEASNHALP